MSPDTSKKEEGGDSPKLAPEGAELPQGQQAKKADIVQTDKDKAILMLSNLERNSPSTDVVEIVGVPRDVLGLN